MVELGRVGSSQLRVWYREVESDRAIELGWSVVE